MAINTDKLSKIQELIERNPVAFLAAVFFVLFGTLFYMFLNKHSKEQDDCEKEIIYWKNKNDIAQKEKDNLTTALLVQHKVIHKVDSTVKKELDNEIQTILR